MPAITSYNALATAATSDLLVIVDVNDTSMSTLGTTKKITVGNLAAFGSPPTGAAGGDLSGTYPNPTVAKVNSAAVPASKTIVGTNGSGQLIDASSSTLANNTTGTAANLTGGATFPAYTAPAVSTLTDAATVVVNAALGNDFRLLTTSGVGGSRQLGAPSNPVDGQRIIFQIKQAASGGPYAVTYNAAYEFSASLPSPTLSSAANAIDLLGFIYNASSAKWFFVAFQAGFS